MTDTSVEADVGHSYTPPVTNLRSRVSATSARATELGALVTVPTDRVVVTDRGLPFLVHVTRLQESKAAAKVDQKARSSNPFLPPDPELVVDDVEPNHVAVLNKFNVIPEHLLIVTRAYEPQDRLLTRGDFRALASCMHDIDGLGFYNGGTTAGASQSHRHLQLIPLPLGGEPTTPTPLDAVLAELPSPGEASAVPVFDFPHVVISLRNARLGRSDAGPLFDHYLRGCSAIGVDDGATPYNLLVTRRWMLLVPRCCEFWNRVSINALGFAGSLLVRDRSELDALSAVGPLAVLRSVVTETAPP